MAVISWDFPLHYYARLTAAAYEAGQKDVLRDPNVERDIKPLQIAAGCYPKSTEEKHPLFVPPLKKYVARWTTRQEVKRIVVNLSRS